jgi:hypothetical protein
MNEIIFSKLHPFCVNLMKNKNKSKFELVEYYEKLNEILTINQKDSNIAVFIHLQQGSICYYSDVL